MPDAPPPKPQIEKFRDLARELECDDDEAAFAEKVKRIATAPREPKPKTTRDDRTVKPNKS
jgi:hypothetical protein